MKALHQEEILKLEDKDLQLRYMLGGILQETNNPCCFGYWLCDIGCSVIPVPEDERFFAVKDFMIKHKIGNSTFYRLVRTYLKRNFCTYQGDFGDLVLELDRCIMGYDLKYLSDKQFKENDFKEKELLELLHSEVKTIEGSDLRKFLDKYSLTEVDFMVLAKTSVNYNYRASKLFEKEDIFIDLVRLLELYNIYQSYEFVKAYRESLENPQVNSDAGKSLTFTQKVRERFRRKK